MQRALLESVRLVQAERGHAKYWCEDPEGHVCLYGAFSLAAGGRAFYGNEHVGEFAAALGFESVPAMCDWNNNKDVTLDDVLTRLDAAIATARDNERVLATV